MMRLVKKTALLAGGALLALTVAACGDNSDDMKSIYKDAKDGKYEKAICSASNLYIDMDESSQKKTAALGRKIVDQASGTEWASKSDNQKYIDLGSKLFDASVAGNKARTDSLSGSVNELC